MTADDFIRSADAAAGPLTAPAARVGQRILDAVEATQNVVGANTNLGIVLLCAPLAAAADQGVLDLRAALASVLNGLDIDDADLAFRAILLASPAGLGNAEDHDVRHARDGVVDGSHGRQRPTATASRINFPTSSADIFDRGLAECDAALRRWADPRWATLSVYLGFLAAFPDTHIVRKYGAAVAEDVRGAAIAQRDRLQATADPKTILDDLLAWDRALKQRGINPGTSADLTVATLFAHRLTGILPSSA